MTLLTLLKIADSDSCADIYESHHFAADATHAAADCLAGGTDINSGSTYSQNIEKGLASGVIQLSDVHNALKNAYGFRMTLGLFDPNVTDPNRDIPISVIGSAEHHLASLTTSRQSMTLLKNDLATGLPFEAGKKLVVVGTGVNNINSAMVLVFPIEFPF